MSNHNDSPEELITLTLSLSKAEQPELLWSELQLLSQEEQKQKPAAKTPEQPDSSVVCSDDANQEQTRTTRTEPVTCGCSETSVKTNFRKTVSPSSLSLKEAAASICLSPWFLLDWRR